MQLLEHFKELTIHAKNAKELKGLILQLAIQGKLTKKWRQEHSSVEDAKNLLDKIQRKKEELIRDKVIRNYQTEPINKNEINFDIPNKWEYVRMIDYLDVRDGTHDTPKYQDTGIPLVTSKNLYSKKLDLTDIKYISNEDHVEISKRSKVDRDDILFAMIGSIGNPVIVDIEPNFSIKNVALIKYYERALVEPQFILYFLENATKQFKQESDGAVQSFVSLKKLRLKELPLPPLEEQKAIVEIVEQLFKEVEQLEAQTRLRIQLKEDYVSSALRTLSTQPTEHAWARLMPHFKEFFTEKSAVKKLRESVLQLAVQGKLTKKWRESRKLSGQDVEPASVLLEKIKAEKEQLIKDKKIKKEKPLPPITEEEIPYELPDGWEWCRLGQYSHYGAINKVENKDVKEDTWVLELEDVEKDSSKLLEKVRFHDRDFKSTKNVFQKGDVVYGKLRPYLDKIILADEEGVCTTEMIPIKTFSGSDSGYLRWFMKSPLFIEYANSSTHGMRMPRLGTDVAKNTIISIPPEKEQKAIVEKVNALMFFCDQLEEAIEESTTQIEQLMQSCLKEIFEG